jgi:hypothetical protein
VEEEDLVGWREEDDASAFRRTTSAQPLFSFGRYGNKQRALKQPHAYLALGRGSGGEEADDEDEDFLAFDEDAARDMTATLLFLFPTAIPPGPCLPSSLHSGLEVYSWLYSDPRGLWTRNSRLG